jgi:hypothetical protein
MSIRIKSGPSLPTTEILDDKQLGFDTTNKRLYIRQGSEIVQIGAYTPEEIGSPTHSDLINATEGLASEEYVNQAIDNIEFEIPDLTSHVTFPIIGLGSEANPIVLANSEIHRLYVCKEINSINNGSEYAPFNVIQDALDSIDPSWDTVVMYIGPGNYAENIVIPDDIGNVILIGEGANWQRLAIISGNIVINKERREEAETAFSNMALCNNGYLEEYDDINPHPLVIDADRVYVTNCSCGLIQIGADRIDENGGTIRSIIFDTIDFYDNVYVYPGGELLSDDGIYFINCQGYRDKLIYVESGTETYGAGGLSLQGVVDMGLVVIGADVIGYGNCKFTSSSGHAIECSKNSNIFLLEGSTFSLEDNSLHTIADMGTEPSCTLLATNNFIYALDFTKPLASVVKLRGEANDSHVIFSPEYYEPEGELGVLDNYYGIEDHLKGVDTKFGQVDDRIDTIDVKITDFFENGVLPPSFVLDLSDYNTKDEVDNKIDNAIEAAFGWLVNKLDGINGEVA